MKKIIQPCSPVIGASFGQKATVDLTIGPRYHAVHFEIIASAANTKTLSIADVLDLISVKIGGKVQRQMTVAELSAIYKAYGAVFAVKSYDYDAGTITVTNGAIVGPQAATVAGGRLTMFQVSIYFAEPWRKSYAAQEAMAWYTAWQDSSVLKSFQIELTIPAISANVLANSQPTINAWAETDLAVGPVDSNKQPVQLICRWERTNVPYSGTGDLVINNLQKRDIVEQISIFGQSGDPITEVKVKVDNTTVREVTNSRLFTSLVGRDWNASGLDINRLDVAFDYADLPTDGLPLNGVRDYQVIPKLGNAAAASKNLTLISQVYGPID